MTYSLLLGIGIRGVASSATFIGGRKAVRRVGAAGAVKAVGEVRAVEAAGEVEAVDIIAWREVGWFVVVEGERW